MDKKTKRTLKKEPLLGAELKWHSVTTTFTARGRSGTEDTQDTQEISIVTKVANQAKQAMSKVDVEGPTNTQDSIDKHTESEEQGSDE